MTEARIAEMGEVARVDETLAKSVGVWLLAVNVIALIVYGLDKARARQRAWRVREAHLLGLALAGGSAGACLAMWMFRHKTSKSSFRRSMYSIITLQALAAMAIWITLYS